MKRCHRDYQWDGKDIKSCRAEKEADCNFSVSKEKGNQQMGDVKRGTNWMNGLCARFVMLHHA